MKRSGFTEQQTAFAFQQAEQGTSVPTPGRGRPFT